jgi:hypothetical protein
LVVAPQFSTVTLIGCVSVEDYVVKDRMSGQKEEEMTPQEKVKAEFKRDHATIRNRWILPENFPSKAVEQVCCVTGCYLSCWMW